LLVIAKVVPSSLILLRSMMEKVLSSETSVLRNLTCRRVLSSAPL
jgi:hypothetical protein